MEHPIVLRTKLRGHTFSGVVQAEARYGDFYRLGLNPEKDRESGQNQEENKKFSFLWKKAGFGARPIHLYKLPYATVWRNMQEICCFI
jgi:hypothetical protein